MAAAGEGGVHGLSTLEFGGLVAFWITFLFFVFNSTWDPFGAPPNRAPAPVRMALTRARAACSLADCERGGERPGNRLRVLPARPQARTHPRRTRAPPRTPRHS